MAALSDLGDSLMREISLLRQRADEQLKKIHRLTSENTYSESRGGAKKKVWEKAYDSESDYATSSVSCGSRDTSSLTSYSDVDVCSDILESKVAKDEDSNSKKDQGSVEDLLEKLGFDSDGYLKPRRSTSFSGSYNYRVSNSFENASCSDSEPQISKSGVSDDFPYELLVDVMFGSEPSEPKLDLGLDSYSPRESYAGLEAQDRSRWGILWDSISADQMVKFLGIELPKSIKDEEQKKLFLRNLKVWPFYYPLPGDLRDIDRFPDELSQWHSPSKVVEQEPEVKRKKKKKRKLLSRLFRRKRGNKL